TAELRDKHHRRVPPIWRLRRKYSQGRQAGGLASSASGQVRDGDQSPDREGARLENLRQSAFARRRGDRVKRREFITLLTGAAAWPLAASAQQAMPVIGFLYTTSPDANQDRLRAFQRGLRESGYVEGENVAIANRSAEGQYDRLPVLAADLVRRQVGVICAAGEASASAAKAATTTIPVVFLVGADPVSLGLVASIARPGGNVTGINFVSGELAAKRLELLHELVPRMARLAVLVNPNSPLTASTLQGLEAVGRVMGLEIQVLRASTSLEIEA